MPGIIQKRKQTPDSAGTATPGELPAEGVTARPIPYVIVFFFGWLVGALVRSAGVDLEPSRREW